MQDLEAFKELLSKPKRVVITTHPKPDADALGSSLGLCNYLLKKGNQVAVITPTDYPDFLSWMKGNEHVLVYENKDSQERCQYLMQNADVVFSLDFSQLDRVGELGEHIKLSEGTKVIVDHHQNPEDFGDFLFWSTKAAATAELIYELIIKLEDKDLIDQDIAECLYAGIMTDTGSFKHPSTTAKVHNIVADLIELGANISKVNKLVYDNNSLNRLKFLGFALSQRLTVNEKLNIAYFVISKEDLNKFDSRTGDTEGVVNYALSIKGIKMAATIIERDDRVRMSFRSVGDFSVSKFADKHFNGGGHKNAAGGSSEVSLTDTVKKFEQVIEEYAEELNYELFENVEQ